MTALFALSLSEDRLFLFEFHYKNLSDKANCPYNCYCFPSQVKIENYRQDCGKTIGNCDTNQN